MEFCSLLENKEMYHRTCVLCSGNVDLVNEDQPDDKTEHLTKFIPRLLRIQAPPDLVNDLPRTSVCSGCSGPVEEGHTMLLQLDQIQKKIDDISILLKVKIMEGFVRQSTASNTQCYPAVRKLTDKVRGSLAGCLNLGSVVNSLARSSVQPDASEQNSVVLDSDDMSLKAEDAASSNDIDYGEGDTDEVESFFSPVNHQTVSNQEAGGVITGIPKSVGHRRTNLQGKTPLGRPTIINPKECISVPSSADDEGLNDVSVVRKRTRNPNFTDDEVSILVSEYKKHKRRSRDPNHPQKRIEWEEIAKTVHKRSSSQVCRTGGQCERKIIDMRHRPIGLTHLLKDDCDYSWKTSDGEDNTTDDDKDKDEDDNDDAVLDRVDGTEEDVEENSSLGFPEERQPIEFTEEILLLVKEYQEQIRRCSDPDDPQNAINWAEIAQAVSTGSSSKLPCTAILCKRKIMDMQRRGDLVLLRQNRNMNTPPEADGDFEIDQDNSDNDDVGTELAADGSQLNVVDKFRLRSKRIPNFLIDEVAILVSEYKKHLRMSADPDHPQERIDWNKIAEEVFTRSSSKYHRTARQCRVKITDLKRRICRGLDEVIDDDKIVNTSPDPEEDRTTINKNHARYQIRLDVDVQSDGGTDDFMEDQGNDDDIANYENAEQHKESEGKLRRKPNFAKDETDILVKEYRKHLVRCADVIDPQKTVDWNQISKAVSTRSSSKVYRSARNCRRKIVDMKHRGQLVILGNSKTQTTQGTDENSSEAQNNLDQIDECVDDSELLADDMEVNDGSFAKRMRMPNFMADEVGILVAEYKLQLVLTSDPSHPQKTIDWDKIAEAVSTRSVSTFRRTAGQCRSKITDMKRKTCTGLDEVVDDDKILKSASEAVYEVMLPNGNFSLRRFVVELVRCDHQKIPVFPVRENIKKKLMSQRIKALRILAQKKRLEQQRKLKCSFCPIQFPTRHLLYRHQTVAHTHPISGAKLTYLCSFDGCHERFASTGNLERHLINVHESQLAYFCDLDDCASGFCTTVALEVHKRRRHDSSLKKFRCDVCGRAFMTEDGCANHMRSHKEGKQFLCETCSQEFRSQRTLESHRGKEHGETFPCPDCPQVCASREALKNHCIVSHLEGGRTKFLRYVCATPDCSRRFRAPSALRYHTQRFHSGEKNFQCDKCPSAFTCERNLVRHTVHTHGDTKKRKCPYCCRVMGQGTLRNHIKVIHEKRTDIKCDICGEGFPLRKYYTRHRDRCHPTNNVHSSTEN